MSVREAALTLLRRLLPWPAKRLLKRIWNPHQPLSLEPALVRSALDLARMNPANSHGAGAPEISIVVVSYHGRDYLRLCVERLLVNTPLDDLEIVVVENGSADGSAEYLRDMAARFPVVKAIFNAGNLGFAAAANQGLAASRGVVLLLLNHDVAVPRDWLVPLLPHLKRAAAGLVVPTTNFAGNEIRVDVPYADLGGLDDFAEVRRRDYAGRSFAIHVAPMFCLALSRETYSRLGPIDERFGPGLFEDDDYSHRARLAGLRVECAEDAFVHHFGQVAFDRMTARQYARLRRTNRLLFERKWGMPWMPHRGR